MFDNVDADKPAVEPVRRFVPMTLNAVPHWFA
jgi:hypothetical protein